MRGTERNRLKSDENTMRRMLKNRKERLRRNMRSPLKNYNKKEMNSGDLVLSITEIGITGT